MEAKDLFQKHTLACLAGGFALGVIVLGIGAAFNSISGSPEFCGTCHAMKGEAASFKESSHKNQQCVECHLPHDNVVVYYVEKGRTGMVDTYHELLRDYPAHIKLSEDARKTVNDNCLRCHDATMGGVHAKAEAMDSGGDCLKCHSRIAHGSNHLEGGIKVE